MKTVEHTGDAGQEGVGEDAGGHMPASVLEALEEIAVSAREGLLALSVGVGMGVMHELMAEEVDEVCGPKGKHDSERKASRHGTERGSVTLGARRVPVERPRVRAADGSGEVPLGTYRHFADRDPLTRVVLEQMLAGVATRRIARTREPVGEEITSAEKSVSRSAVSREFVARTRENLDKLMSRDLGDIRLAALMIDGIDLKGRCCVVALGIDTEGQKTPLGLWDGSTENKTITVELLTDLVDRGLDVEQGVLVVLDGAKALHSAVRAALGPVPIQRCRIHKERNVLDHLPERDRPQVKRRLRAAWKKTDHDQALGDLNQLAGELERSHPGAARSLREGLKDTLTLQRLKADPKLHKSLGSTNPIESMISTTRKTARNVKRWQSGDMCLRWTAAGMLEAERSFRKIVGHKHLAALAIAVEHETAASRGLDHATQSPPQTATLTLTH